MLGPPLRDLFANAGFAALIILIASLGFRAQSQALDGQIEGWVTDANGSAVVGASVFARNTGTGFVRSTITEANGFYRVLLLPLGTYQLSVEAPTFKRAVRDNINLTAGHIVTIDIPLSPGEMVETVTISAENQIADPGRTDTGGRLGDRETANLPLVSRSTFNLILQQANVSGRPNRSIFMFPVVSANGFRSRVQYQLDGSTATPSQRAGTRLLTVPEPFVKEVQFVSNAFAAEFGNTPGVIMNLITPSGTNEVDGSVTYFFRFPSMYSRPFGYTAPDLQDSRFHDVAVKFGSPVIKDRWHLFAGYEQFLKDDKGIPNRLLTISESNKAALIAAGLPASIFVPAVPTIEHGRFLLVRSDLQLNEAHRLAVRFNHGNIIIENSIAGGINTLERTVDTKAKEHAVAGQLVSYSKYFVNELRIQFAHRSTATLSNELSGAGPSIVIPQGANFGAPEGADGPPNVEMSVQVQNNFTYTTGAHVAKFGGGSTIPRTATYASIFARFTFPSIQAYVNARDGLNLRSYTRYNESSGDPESRIGATYWNAFVQDDWKVTPRLKLNFGLRYDLYKIPEADSSAPLPVSRSFKLDKDNFAPRIAAVYALRQGQRPSIIRAGAGLYYENPWLELYERALRQNGNPRYFNFAVTPESPAAPNFPAVFPQGLQLSPQDIDTVSPDLENLYAIQANIQFEQAISESSSVAIGYAHSGGRMIPVYSSRNFIPVRFLSDGRPVYSRLINASTRYDPRFNNITIVESAGRSRYDSLTAQYRGRFSQRLVVSAYYTYSKATDDAPEQNIVFPNFNSSVLGDPWDRSYEHGRSFGDQRHTFVMNMVANPDFNLENAVARAILNNNQIAVGAYANSGYAYTIVSSRDLNEDGLLQDRPVGIPRNSGTTPALFNLDLRYSRIIPLGERFRLEIFAEFTNVFNFNSIVQYNNTSVATANTGELIAGIPDFRSLNQSTFQESRQTQFGIRLVF